MVTNGPEQQGPSQMPARQPRAHETGEAGPVSLSQMKKQQESELRGRVGEGEGNDAGLRMGRFWGVHEFM